MYQLLYSGFNQFDIAFQGALPPDVGANMGSTGYDAVKYLLLCRIQKQPPRLDLDIHPG